MPPVIDGKQLTLVNTLNIIINRCIDDARSFPRQPMATDRHDDATHPIVINVTGFLTRMAAPRLRRRPSRRAHLQPECGVYRDK